MQSGRERRPLEPTVGNYDGNVCNYIEGRLILYMSQGSTGDLEDQAANETLHIIKEGMDTDDFARAHEGINRLTFVEERWDDTVNPKIDSTDSKTEKKLIPMYTWLLVASGGTLICFSIAVASRRWKRTTTRNDGLASSDGLAYGELICGSDNASGGSKSSSSSSSLELELTITSLLSRSNSGDSGGRTGADGISSSLELTLTPPSDTTDVKAGC